MTKLFSPILAFTCDEIWLAMPHRSEDDARNVVLNEMNKPFAEYALDDAAMQKWSRIIAVRTAVNGALEAARAEKKIGKALEALVCLKAEDTAAAEALKLVEGLDLAELFIVSAVTTDNAQGDALALGKGANYPGLTVEVHAAPGEKCPRCWMHSVKADENGLCPRCSAVMASFVFED
jgi:isoleucyl-tRNA synthetase